MFCRISAGSSSRASRQQAPEEAGEDVELFEVGVLEWQYLGEEGVQAPVVAELATEVASLGG